jgi:hypothetical protein
MKIPIMIIEPLFLIIYLTAAITINLLFYFGLINFGEEFEADIVEEF